MHKSEKGASQSVGGSKRERLRTPRSSCQGSKTVYHHGPITRDRITCGPCGAHDSRQTRSAEEGPCTAAQRNNDLLVFDSVT